MKKFFLLGFLAVTALAFTAFRNSDNTESANNATGKNIVVGSDLVIQNPSIICSSQRWLVFYVKNQGGTKSIATLVRARAPQGGDGPTELCMAQAVKNVAALVPGKTIKIRIPLKTAGAGCDCTGCLRFELFVDYLNYVSEDDESNNIELFEPNCN